MAVGESIRCNSYSFESAQKLKERITGRGYQHFIAWISQELEKKAIGFARACSEKNLLVP